jgi:gas vesicle protein
MFKSQPQHNYGSFASGFLTGGLIIGGLALLFAPKKGSVLRSKIGKAKDKMLKDAGTYLDTAGEYLNSAKEKGSDLISTGTDKISQLLESAEGKIVDNAGHFIAEGHTKLDKVLDSTSNKTKDRLKHKH